MLSRPLLALLPALALLVLGSGVANAEETAPADPLGTITDTAAGLLSPGPAPSAGGNGAQDEETTPALPDVELVPSPVAPAGGELPGSAGRPEESADPADPTEDPGAVPAAPGPADLEAACQELLGMLPAGRPAPDCGAVAECAEVLLPDGVPPEDLADLTPEELEELLGSVDVEGFLACIEDAVGELVPPAPPITAPAVQETHYENCDDARARGAAPVFAGQPGYRPGLDSDVDGIGCEETDGTGTAVIPVSTTLPATGAGQLAYTGVEVTPLLAAAAAVVALGGGLLLAARRRS